MSAWALERAVRRDRTYCGWSSGSYNPCPVLREILGEDHTTTTAQAPAARHGIILWAHVVTAYEAEFNRDAHRDTSPARAAYLTHLQTLGYTLSDVEQVIIDNTTPYLPETESSAGEQPADDQPADEQLTGDQSTAEQPADDQGITAD